MYEHPHAPHMFLQNTHLTYYIHSYTYMSMQYIPSFTYTLTYTHSHIHIYVSIQSVHIHYKYSYIYTPHMYYATYSYFHININMLPCTFACIYSHPCAHYTSTHVHIHSTHASLYVRFHWPHAKGSPSSVSPKWGLSFSSHTEGAVPVGCRNE